ncbi:hypothetical protein AUI06_06985 [archaeon 13_2_20CM_2_52_21]|nr:MAG: hypothetical protein AUI06_06985 [archaeon 13_2_20CM_2_52_21]
MSSFPQKPTADLKSVKSLLENHNPRETYEILAAQIILANKRTQDLIPPSRVQTETRKIRITETDLHEIRTGRFCRVQPCLALFVLAVGNPTVTVHGYQTLTIQEMSVVVAPCDTDCRNRKRPGVFRADRVEVQCAQI